MHELQASCVDVVDVVLVEAGWAQQPPAGGQLVQRLQDGVEHSECGVRRHEHLLGLYWYARFQEAVECVGGS